MDVNGINELWLLQYGINFTHKCFIALVLLNLSIADIV
jgi:hypothetical protein